MINEGFESSDYVTKARTNQLPPIKPDQREFKKKREMKKISEESKNDGESLDFHPTPQDIEEQLSSRE